MCTYLGTLPGDSRSSAEAINASGQIVGSSRSETDNPYTSHAFLYSGGQMKDLGTLDGGSSSVANDINNSGQVVGWSTKSNAESNAYPFLYSDGQMHDLNSLIPAGSGWQLFSAEAINSSGQIVGRGSLPGASGQRAFIATPDTPIKEDTIDPEIAINTPPQGATYNVGQAVAASYSCTDADSGVASCEGPVAEGANIDTSSAGTKTFTVRATDNVGNTNSVSHTYTVNDAPTTAPTVISTVPQANATGVAPAVNVRATFSAAMDASKTDGDPSTINGTTFKLFRAGTTTRIRAVVGYDATAKKAILNPNANLQRGTKYKAVVTTGAEDLAGNRLDQKSSLSGSQPKEWVFTVRR